MGTVAMKASNLEKVIITRFLEDPAVKPVKRSIDFESVDVVGREFTGVGFVTDFRRAEEMRLFGDDSSMRWGRVGAWLNVSRVETGYIVYVDGGYLTAMEGYTYGEDWPAEVEQVELYDLK
jgi:hypothetical protein